ncbi:MAG: hypothetical protein IT436_03175 [Phycisphaerales bacterium]|nr:hypothetical protein [Phycisphaerales bacterium]
MPNLLTFLCFRPRALLVSLAAAGSLAAMGCVGYHPGGNLQSEDTFTYWSTPHMPQTVTLVDTRTNEKMWTYEIPVGKELVMKFYKDTSPGEHLSDTMRWEVMDVEKTSGPLDNVLPVPDQFSRRVDVEVRPTPEQPPADAEASAEGSMGAAGGAK